MPRIINGKTYDIHTAKLVGSWNNGRARTDFEWFEESMYRKRTGEFFLYCEGGPMSRYAGSSGDNTWRPGHLITPLSYQAAVEWGKKHLDSKKYEAFFGKIVEDDTRTVAGFSLSQTALAVLRRMSQEQGKARSEIIENLIMANKK